jgi:hypothetical protein
MDYRIAIGLLVGASMNLGCDSAHSPVQPATPPVESTAPFVVSNPVAGPSASSTDASVRNEPTIAYISLQPRTIANATSATIHVPGAISLRVPMIDGGFDPIAVRASFGDSITITVSTTVAANPVTFVFAVPLKARPKLVRTNPPRHKRDVTLNSRVTVVFSEPIDGASLTNGSILLRKGATVVSGQLAFGNPEHTIVEFAPLSVLDPATEYELSIAQAIRDLDAETLDSASIIPFTTAATSVPAPGALSVIRSQPVAGSRDVKANTVVEIWFSERVNFSSLQPSVSVPARIRLFHGSSQIPFFWGCMNSIDGTCTSVTLVPVTTLAAGADHRVVIDAGITGVSGAALAAEVTIPFATAIVPEGPPVGTLTVASFQMIEFSSGGGDLQYAPLVRVEAQGGGLSIDKLVFEIPGFQFPIMPLCSGPFVPAGMALDLFTEIYGDYQITFSRPPDVARPAGEAIVDIHYTDLQGRSGVVTARTPVAPGGLPTTYTGGVPYTRWELGPSCR